MVFFIQRKEFLNEYSMYVSYILLIHLCYMLNMCMHVLIHTVKNILSISIGLSSIEMLSGSMLKLKQNLEIMLGIKDLDLALRENPPT